MWGENLNPASILSHFSQGSRHLLNYLTKQGLRFPLMIRTRGIRLRRDRNYYKVFVLHFCRYLNHNFCKMGEQ